MKKLLLLMMLVTCVYAFTQNANSKTNQANNKVVYLPKTDAIYMAIKARVINDFKISKQNADPQTPNNKLRAKKLQSFSGEKQKKYYALFEKSMRDYTMQLDFDFETFMLVFSGFSENEQKKWKRKVILELELFGQKNKVRDIQMTNLYLPPLRKC